MVLDLIVIVVWDWCYVFCWVIWEGFGGWGRDIFWFGRVMGMKKGNGEGKIGCGGRGRFLGEMEWRIWCLKNGED